MTPASALSVAKQFHHAFELCHGNGLTTIDDRPNAVVPSVVNLAFAVELALKAVHLSYGTSPRTHELQKLFQKLLPLDQAAIRGLVPEEGARFDEQLEAVSEAFVEWRYIHEEPGYKSISIQFLMHLWGAVKQLAEEKKREQIHQLRKSLRDA